MGPGRQKLEQEKILGSGRNMRGYILTYSSLQREEGAFDSSVSSAVGTFSAVTQREK